MGWNETCDYLFWKQVMFLVSDHEFGVIQKCVEVMMCMGYFLIAMEWQRLSFLFEGKKTTAL